MRASKMIKTIQGKDLIAELEAVEKLPPIFNEDCPPMTEEQLR